MEHKMRSITEDISLAVKSHREVQGFGKMLEAVMDMSLEAGAQMLPPRGISLLLAFNEGLGFGGAVSNGPILRLKNLDCQGLAIAARRPGWQEDYSIILSPAMELGIKGLRAWRLALVHAVTDAVFSN